MSQTNKTLSHRIIRSVEHSSNTSAKEIDKSEISSFVTEREHRINHITEESLQMMIDSLLTKQFILRLNLFVGADRPFLSETIVNSMFVPGNGTEFVKLLETIPDDHFIIGIGYPEDKSGGGDAQQGITGTANSELDSDPIQTVCRETLEETGLVSDKIIFRAREERKKYQSQPSSQAQIWRHHTTSISNCTIQPQVTCKRVNKQFDNKQRKVSNIVHGTAEEMIRTFVQIAATDFSSNDDNISYLIATPVCIAKELVKVSMRKLSNGKKNWTPTRHNVSDFL